MDAFSLLIKPVSSDCNLRCRYCFYRDTAAALYPERRVHRMSEATQERLIRAYLATEQPIYAFAWQGGEPALAGLPFYRRATAMQQTFGRPGARVANAFQTNGTLLDAEWAAFLARYHFLVGVSLDGPAALHDRARRDAGGKPSHARVLAALALLRLHAVQYNVLTLVNAANVGQPEAVYDFLCDQGVQFHQYIECVEFQDGQPRPCTISAEAWGEFLCRIFDRWYPRDVRRISVRLFDTVLEQMVLGRDNTCASGTACDQYFVVEHNGDVYPCDFHVRAEWRLGNIRQDEWASLRASPRYKAFAAAKRAWAPCCQTCRWGRFCHGDCPKNRPAGAGSRSHLCAGWQRFYAHAMPRLETLAQELRAERLAAGAP